MLLLARRNLFSERTRLAISVGGVALSVFLISLLLSLYRGWDSKVGGFVEKSNVDIWIGSEGARDFLSAASLLPTSLSSGLGSDPELQQSVDEASPVIDRPVEGIKVKIMTSGAEERDVKMDLQFIGFDTGTGLGGPIKVIEGNNTVGPGEVIVDKALTRRYGVQVGDTIEAGGRDWKVVGRSDEGDFVASQTVFVSLPEAQDALGIKDQTTYFAIRLKPGVDPQDFAGKVESEARAANQPVVAFTRDQFAGNTRHRILSNVLPILAVVLGLAFIVGLAVAGLTIYTATVEKAREYGILKAVGFANRYLYRTVLEQSLVTGFLGFAFGVGLTLILGPFASDLVPQFVLFTRWQDILGVAGVTLLMAAIAAYIPVRRLAAIDPVAVFKA